MLSDYLKLIRPVNCFMSAVAVLITLMIVLPNIQTIGFLRACLAMATAFVICGAGMAVNDYYDVEIDKINKPKRPIPSGRINKKNAMIFAIFLFLIGIALAFFINKYAFYIAIINSVVEFLYAWKLKKVLLLGHLLVSYLVASLFIFGGAAMFDIVGLTKLTSIIILSALAFFSNMGREIYKSAADVLGDKQFNVTSFATKFKIPTAKKVASVFLIIAILLSPLPFLIGIFGIYYLSIVIIADAVFVAAMVVNVSNAEKYCKAAMIIALVAFLLGAL